MLQIPNKKWVNANNAQNIPGTKKNSTGTIILNYLTLIFGGFFWGFFWRPLNHYELIVN